MRTTRTVLLLAAYACCTISAERLYAEKWNRPPLPSAAAVQSADFGPKPDSVEVQEYVDHLLVYHPVVGSGPGPWGLGRDRWSASHLRLDGEPKRAYLYQAAAGGAGTYRFGWEQTLLFESYAANNGVHVGNLWVFVFFLEGKPAYETRNANEDCLVPIGTSSSADTPCAELGTAVPVPADYSFPESTFPPGVGSSPARPDQSVRVTTGMAASDIKKAAKAAELDSLEKGDRLEIGRRNPSSSDEYDIFLLQNGRIYALVLH